MSRLINHKASAPADRSRRQRIAEVARSSKGVITLESAAKTLGLPTTDAAKVLWRWTRQGWLRHIRRGVYAPVPIDARPGDQVISDPWVLIPELFAPAYVGGWSAAEHWDLTEQIFNTVLVFTSRDIRPREQTLQGNTFRLKKIAQGALFGTVPVWRGNVNIQVSDPHRTIVDMVDEPASGGGIRHVQECLKNYLKLPQADLPKVVEYGAKLGNSAIFKRLGFLLERMNESPAIQKQCAERLAPGNAKLDPSMLCPRIVTRWKLCVPQNWKETRDNPR